MDKTRNLTIAVPALVDEDLWQRAQVALDASGNRGLRKTRYAYLLEGLGICSTCGAPMQIRSRVWDARRNGRHQEAAYICKGRRMFRVGGERCSQPIVSTAEADAQAWRAISDELSDPTLADAIAREITGQGEDAVAWAADAENYRQHLGRLERVESAVLDRYRRGLVSDAALDLELARLSKERDGVRSQLATAERAMSGTAATRERMDDAMAVLDDLRCVLAETDFETRRELVKLLVPRGGVAFAGRALRVTLLIPRGQRLDLVGGSDSSAARETHLRLRVVARR